MIKVTLAIIGSFFFWSAIGIADSRIDQSNWKTLNNKYGWRIKIPTCWDSNGIDDLSGEESPDVHLVSGQKCIKQSSDYMAIQISFGINEKMEKPEVRVGYEVSHKIQRKEEFFKDTIPLKQGEAVYVLKSNDPNSTKTIPPKKIAWIVYTNCNSKNLDIKIVADVSKERIGLPLNKQKMPEILEKITETFECVKP